MDAKNISTKHLLKNPNVSNLLLSNNLIATRDLLIRIFVELILLYSVYRFFEAGYIIFALIFYYVLAIWHSFWGYAGIAHELMHGKVFSSKIINKLFYKISSFLVWSNPGFFTVTHLHHHGHTFAPTDFESTGVTNWDTASVMQYLLLDVPFMIRRISYSIINALGKKYDQGQFVPIENTQSSSARWMIFFNLFLHVVIYLIAFDLLYNLLFFILPFFGQLLNKILAQSQHLGLKKYLHEGPMKHSRSIYLPRAISFLYANMNYHAEHHLIPSVPYYNLPKLSNHLTKFNGDYTIHWKKFFTKDFFILLKNQNNQ